MAHWQMLNQPVQISVHYSSVFAHCLVDSKPLNFSLLQVKARKHKSLYFPQPESCVFKKALIWNTLNMNHRMGISFFRKLSWPRSSVFFHLLLCAVPADWSSRAAGTAFCPGSVLKGRKSLGGIMPGELSYFTLCNLQYEICVRWHLGEQGEGKKMSIVNPWVQQGFVCFTVFVHNFEQPWGGFYLWFDYERKRGRSRYSHYTLHRQGKDKPYCEIFLLNFLIVTVER